MSFFKKISNLLNLFEEFQKMDKKIELIEEKLKKAYIFTDITVFDTQGTDFEEPDECPDGCTYQGIGRAKRCSKCGRTEKESLLNDMN